MSDRFVPVQIPIPAGLVNYGGPWFTWLSGLLCGIGAGSLKVPGSPNEFFASGDFAFTLGALFGAFAACLAVIKEGKVGTCRKHLETLVTHEKTIEQLKTEIRNRDADYFGSWAFFFKEVIQDVLNLPGNTERATVYKYDGNAFYRLGRWSDHPEWTLPGRKSFMKYGIIWEAFQNNCAYVNDIPSINGDATAYEAYHQTRWQLSSEEAAALRMKSRSYAAFAIRNKADTKVAVLVFESLTPSIFQEHKLKPHLNAIIEKTTKLMQSLEQREPDPELAKNLGY